jgi:hypothetical protein
MGLLDLDDDLDTGETTGARLVLSSAHGDASYPSASQRVSILEAFQLYLGSRLFSIRHGMTARVGHFFDAESV